jgi:hypothetical protein
MATVALQTQKSKGKNPTLEIGSELLHNIARQGTTLGLSLGHKGAKFILNNLVAGGEFRASASIGIRWIGFCLCSHAEHEAALSDRLAWTSV